MYATQFMSVSKMCSSGLIQPTRSESESNNGSIEPTVVMHSQDR